MPSRGDARMALGLAGTLAELGRRESRARVAGLVRRRGDHAAGGFPPSDFDPFDPAVVADPYPAYAALHRRGPVHYSRKRRLWVLSGYDVVRGASRAHDVFSSGEGVTRYRSRIPTLLTSDRPDHTRLRRLVAGDFTRDAMERWRPVVERLARDAVDQVVGQGQSDFVAGLASPFPVAVIARVLGVPRSDLPEFRRWSDRVVEGFAAAPGPGSWKTSVHVLGGALKLRAYFREHFRHLRENPGDDVLSGLLASSEEGRLTEDELFWFAFVLLVAGNETTSSLLGTMMLSFAEHPDQYARVRARAELVPAAIEESLRHTAPIQGMYRTALADYRVGGAVIPAGARVLLLFGAANRDPRHYNEPGRFLVERDPGDHLGFGSGIHFCLGAHLARLEASVVLDELVRRVERVELAAGPEWNYNPTLRGLARLELRHRAG